MGSADSRYWGAVLRRRWPTVLVTATALTAAAVTLALLLPASYRAQAVLQVEPQPVPGDTAAALAPAAQLRLVEERLMSPENLRALAERAGPEGGDMAALRRRIEVAGEVAGPGEDDTVAVAFWAPTAAGAQAGAEALVTLILAENDRLPAPPAADAEDPRDAEVARLAEAIDAQTVRIAEFKAAHLDALPDSLATRRAQQQREQERLLALEREESALRQQRGSVLQVYGGRPSVAPRTPEEVTLADLRSQLVQQRAVYAPSSPAVRVLESRIAGLEALVAEQTPPEPRGGSGQPQGSGGVVEAEVAPIDARLDFIAEEKAALAERLARLEDGMQQTPANEMALAELERALEALRRQREAAVARRDEAAAGERLEQRAETARVALVSAPALPERPARPNRVLISAAGLGIGLVAGLALVALSELLNRSVRRPAELSARLGLQPLATVPYIWTAVERRRRGGMVALALGLAAVAVPAGLMALHSHYMPLDALVGHWFGAGAAPAAGFSAG
jgi:uncharacterized protein involved in exopolysaccharide biosynthesis